MRNPSGDFMLDPQFYYFFYSFYLEKRKGNESEGETNERGDQREVTLPPPLAQKRSFFLKKSIRSLPNPPLSLFDTNKTEEEQGESGETETLARSTSRSTRLLPSFPPSLESETDCWSSEETSLSVRLVSADRESCRSEPQKKGSRKRSREGEWR